MRGDDAAPAQAGEDLLQIGLRDLLARGDLGHGNGAIAAASGEIGHRHHGVASFGRKLHLAARRYFLAISEPLLLKAAALARRLILGAGLAMRPLGGM
jgi:hypothetical protein